jgi:hypothetical protein
VKGMMMTMMKDAMTENDQLEYNDAIVSFNSIITQYGISRVLMDFQLSYPETFLNIQRNIGKFPAKPTAALLRK